MVSIYSTYKCLNIFYSNEDDYNKTWTKYNSNLKPYETYSFKKLGRMDQLTHFCPRSHNQSLLLDTSNPSVFHVL